MEYPAIALYLTSLKRICIIFFSDWFNFLP